MLPLDLSLWHKQLGHHNYEDIKLMIKVVGSELDSKVKPDPICEPCLSGKMHANPFLSSENWATELLELIHSDVYDAGHNSHGGYRYWCSRKSVAVPMKRKSGAFKTFKAYAEKQTGKLVKCFREDKGGEYMSNEFDAYLKECGIARQHSVRNRPQQNGVAERTNRTLEERITALLSEANLSKAFWAECLSALVHVLDCCPTTAVKGSTPYEKWFGRKPDVGHLQVWGCLAYVQSLSRIFIGYPEGYKGWKFYNPETKRVIISEQADFDERYSYWGELLRREGDSTNPMVQSFIPIEQEPTLEAPQEPVIVEQPVEDVLHEPQPEIPAMPLHPAVADDIELPIALRRTRREVRAPGEWWKVRHPLSVIDSDDSDEDEEGAHVVISGEIEPQSYREALELPLADKWQDACLEEYNWHLQNGTGTLMELPPGMKAIGIQNQA
jgi:hypothetical protein